MKHGNSRVKSFQIRSSSSAARNREIMCPVFLPNALYVGNTPHALVAAILSSEAGIGVRSGCFCAQSYAARLLRLSPAEQDARRREHLAGDCSRTPGMVRVSLGAYNTSDEIDALIEMLERIAQGNYLGKYYQVIKTGDYRMAVGDDQVAACYEALMRPRAVEVPEPCPILGRT